MGGEAEDIVGGDGEEGVVEGGGGGHCCGCGDVEGVLEVGWRMKLRGGRGENKLSNDDIKFVISDT